MIFNEKYTLLKAERSGLLAERIESLETQLQKSDEQHKERGEQRVFSRFYFSDILNQLPVLRNSSLWERLEQSPLSYIEQPPLDGSKLSLLVAYAPQVEVTRIAPVVWKVQSPDGCVYFQSVRLSDAEAAGSDSLQQTEQEFDRHIDFLKSRRLTLHDNCIRTWIYVRDIDFHYAGVVEGRNRVFEREGLTAEDHFIASTGIGGNGAHTKASVCMDFLSMDAPKASVRYLHAPEWLNPTHEYGVAFERGTAVTLGGVQTSFISGTASIDKHGDCLYRGNVLKQTERLFQNIDQLLQNGGSALSEIRCLTVYLRDIADYPLVADYLKTHFAGVPAIVTEARVCRPEWLIEVECIAARKLVK